MRLSSRRWLDMWQKSWTIAGATPMTALRRTSNWWRLVCSISASLGSCAVWLTTLLPKPTYGLRNRIVHDYEGVNLMLVWEIISEDLPELQNTLKQLL